MLGNNGSLLVVSGAFFLFKSVTIPHKVVCLHLARPPALGTARCIPLVPYKGATHHVTTDSQQPGPHLATPTQAPTGPKMLDFGDQIRTGVAAIVSTWQRPLLPPSSQQ
jgi:hypothetical protein